MKIRNKKYPRQEYENFYSNPEYYKAYRNEKNKLVTYSQFARVIKKFNKGLLELIMETGFEWNMFAVFGRLAVYKWKPVIKRLENGRLNLPINPKETAKLWREKPELKQKQYVYYMNEHSEGNICKIFWHKFKYGFPNQSLLMLGPARYFTTGVSEAIRYRDAWENYFILEKLNSE